MSCNVTPQIPYEVVLSAVYKIFGQDAILEDFSNSLATPSIQGFSSQIVRVRTAVSLNGHRDIVTLIAKCLPAVQQESDKQKDTIERFVRESAFFTTAVPKLFEKCSELPIVRCHLVQEDILIMEDLNATGYFTLTKGMKDVGDILLTQTHVKLLLQKLAQLNAASLGVDWVQEIPILKTQNFFNIDPSPKSFNTMCIQAFKSAAIILSEHFPTTSKTICDWLLSSASFDTLVKLSKPVDNSICVLTHGDFWINNMLFHIDPNTEQPLDVKLIDFQLFRLAHPTRDILHVMYACLDKKFREQYEDELLDAYVTAFNVTAGEDLLQRDTFKSEYNEARLFGCLVATVLRSLNLMSDIYPDENETLSQETFEGVMCGDQYSSMPRRFKHEPRFAAAITEVLDELVTVANDYLLLQNQA